MRSCRRIPSCAETRLKKAWIWIQPDTEGSHGLPWLQLYLACEMMVVLDDPVPSSPGSPLVETNATEGDVF